MVKPPWIFCRRTHTKNASGAKPRLAFPPAWEFFWAQKISNFFLQQKVEKNCNEKISICLFVDVCRTYQPILGDQVTIQTCQLQLGTLGKSKSREPKLPDLMAISVAISQEINTHWETSTRPNKNWLVVDLPLWKILVSSSVGMIFHSQLNGKSYNLCSKPQVSWDDDIPVYEMESQSKFHGSSHHQPDYYYPLLTMIHHY